MFQVSKNNHLLKLLSPIYLSYIFLNIKKEITLTCSSDKNIRAVGKLISKTK